MFSHLKLFFREFLKSPTQVAAVVPTSRALADAMVHIGIVAVRQHYQTLNILEVGGGTGAVTQRLIQRLNPEDRLTVVEANLAFYRHLKSVIEELRRKSPDRFPQVSLVQGTYPDVLKTPDQYHWVITSVPFNAFSRTAATTIFERMLEHVSRPGVIVFQDYPLMRMVNNAIRRFVPGIPLGGLPKIRDVFSSEFDAFRLRLNEKFVLWNLPPAKAFCLEKIKAEKTKV